VAAGVLCAVQGSAEALLVQAVEATGRLTVVRRCADLVELLAAAEAGLGRLAFVSAELEHLDREAVADLHRGGVRVVCVADQARPWLTDRLAACGADLVVPPPGDAGAARGIVGRALALLDAAVPDTAPTWLAGPPPAAPTRRGRLVAVWGPTGAPGRTTLAVNLAAELAALGRDALLVDADTYGGAVAQVLGLLDEAPGIAAAARAATQGGLDLAALARLCPLVGGLRVLTGIGRPERWPELPAAALDALWPVARSLAPWTVVDVGFCLEQDEVLSYDTRAPQRNAATLSALRAADVVVAVGSGDPVGVVRLVRALGDLAEAAPDVPRLVVVNRLRPSAAGPHAERAVLDALARYAGVGDGLVVPDDRATCDAALLAGRTLRETAPGSSARRAIAGIAARLAAGVPAVPGAPATPAA
jgi:MinD-like ATPase involved in chromosome partitioning or flagellar assembly